MPDPLGKRHTPITRRQPIDGTTTPTNAEGVGAAKEAALEVHKKVESQPQAPADGFVAGSQNAGAPVAGDRSASASNVFNLQLARAGTLPPAPPVASRAQALADVKAEAVSLGIEIRTGQEADEYLNFAAKMGGVDPASMHACTLGRDLIFVREAFADDPRVLREELIHTQQQAAGMAIDLSSTADAEVEARKLMIEHKDRWGITDDEVAEMKSDIALIEQRGRY